MPLQPPARNLSRESTTWGRWVEGLLSTLSDAQYRQTQAVQNALAGVNGAIQGLTAQTVVSANTVLDGGPNGTTTATVQLDIPSFASNWRATATYTVMPNSESGGGGGATVTGYGKVTIHGFEIDTSTWVILQESVNVEPIDSDPAGKFARTIQLVVNPWSPTEFSKVRATIETTFFGGAFGGGGQASCNLVLYSNR
jgi:hypothetical protein